MINAKLFSALAIVVAVAIAPASIAFAQADASVENSKNRIDKEEQKAFFDKIKIEKQKLRDQIQDFNDQKDRQVDSTYDRIHADPTVLFKGQTSGWAIVNNQAYTTEFNLNGKAGPIEKGWQIKGEGTVFVGDREIPFDLKGFTKKNHVNIKGVSQDNDSVRIHLKGNFAPVAENEGSYALAFTRASLTVEESDVKVPLMLVGEVTTSPIISEDTPVSDETEFEADLRDLDEMLELLT